MVVTETEPSTQMRVIVGEGIVHIESFDEFDPTTVSFIAQAEDPIRAVGQLLRTGARALQAVGNEMVTENIQMRLDAVSKEFADTVNEAVREISSVTEAIVDDEKGKLPTKLTEFVDGLGTLLGETFDPESKTSVMAEIEKRMTEAANSQTVRIREMVTLENENSPLNILKREIKREIIDVVRDVRKDFDDLAKEIVTKEAFKTAREKSSAKGFDFEETIHDKVSSIAAAHGDIAESVGNVNGAEANKKGDELVQLNREDTNGVETFFVWEVKAKKLSMRATQEELESSIANRNAAAGIIIFEDQSLAPTSVPFQYSDNKAIVALNRDDTDDSVIQLAYMWARWVARRNLNQVTTEKFDTQKFQSLLETALRSLNSVRNIKSANTSAKKSIEKASELLGELQNEMQGTLEQLKEELTVGTPIEAGVNR